MECAKNKHAIPIAEMSAKLSSPRPHSADDQQGTSSGRKPTQIDNKDEVTNPSPLPSLSSSSSSPSSSPSPSSSTSRSGPRFDHPLRANGHRNRRGRKTGVSASGRRCRPRPRSVTRVSKTDHVVFTTNLDTPKHCSTTAFLSHGPNDDRKYPSRGAAVPQFDGATPTLKKPSLSELCNNYDDEKNIIADSSKTLMTKRKALHYPQRHTISVDKDDENVSTLRQQQHVSVFHMGQSDGLCRNFNVEFDRIAMAGGNEYGGHGDEKLEEDLGFQDVKSVELLQQCSQQAHDDRIAAFRSKWGYDVVHDCPVMGTVWNWEVLLDCDTMQRYNSQAVPM